MLFGSLRSHWGMSAPGPSLFLRGAASSLPRQGSSHRLSVSINQGCKPGVMRAAMLSSSALPLSDHLALFPETFSSNHPTPIVTTPSPVHFVDDSEVTKSGKVTKKKKRKRKKSAASGTAEMASNKPVSPQRKSTSICTLTMIHNILLANESKRQLLLQKETVPLEDRSLTSLRKAEAHGMVTNQRLIQAENTVEIMQVYFRRRDEVLTFINIATAVMQIGKKGGEMTNEDEMKLMHVIYRDCAENLPHFEKKQLVSILYGSAFVGFIDMELLNSIIQRLATSDTLWGIKDISNILFACNKFNAFDRNLMQRFEKDILTSVAYGDVTSVNAVSASTILNAYYKAGIKVPNVYHALAKHVSVMDLSTCTPFYLSRLVTSFSKCCVEYIDTEDCYDITGPLLNHFKDHFVGLKIDAVDPISLKILAEGFGRFCEGLSLGEDFGFGEFGFYSFLPQKKFMKPSADIIASTGTIISSIKGELHRREDLRTCKDCKSEFVLPRWEKSQYMKRGHAIENVERCQPCHKAQARRQDETRVCRECSNEFVFTKSEQNKFVAKGWDLQTQDRCLSCKIRTWNRKHQLKKPKN